MQQILPEVLRTRLDIELQIRIDNNMIQRTNSTIFVGRRQLPRFVESATTQRPTCSYANVYRELGVVRKYGTRVIGFK